MDYKMFRSHTFEMMWVVEYVNMRKINDSLKIINSFCFLQKIKRKG